MDKPYATRPVDFQPASDFFIGIDSDGCVFDSMGAKHRTCFCPNFIAGWGLKPISEYAEEVWEFVNLYSSTRGVNRFLALSKAMDLLSRRKEVVESGFSLPDMADLDRWIKNESKLGNPALEKHLEKTESQVLQRALQWTYAINRDIRTKMDSIAPFPYVRESLEQASGLADMTIISQTPLEALEKEWSEQDLIGFIRLVAGQEAGTKSEQIRSATKSRYRPENVLMIGDAPGDLVAARDNGSWFYPILPGREADSWRQFSLEALPLFIGGKYTIEYETGLIRDFQEQLPEQPVWSQVPD